MDPGIVRDTLIGRIRHHSENLDEAARALVQGMRVPRDVVDDAVEAIREEGRKNRLLRLPRGVSVDLEREARLADWYTGPEKGDVFWPKLRLDLEAGPLREVLDEIDQASTKVVANLSDPHRFGLKKKGLVVGYVQSGKTANYTAVMAKSADAGYRLFIVLAGMYNNLRRQTQNRLSQDLLNDQWAKLTTPTEDFDTVINGAPLLSQGVHCLAVVKKNQHRLRRLRDWLRDIPKNVRRACPALLIDDEADQATPNTKGAQDKLSRINQLVRQVWAELPTGSYVGYTATPFANVFMNPQDDEGLYPSDFIIDLPRSEDYFGAERIFGRVALDDADDPDPSLDMVRVIPDDEADAVRPPSAKEEQSGFEPPVTQSLREAVLWFVVATAIRRARGQHDQHSSMLIHTTHYVIPHFKTRQVIDGLLDELRLAATGDDFSDFHSIWQAEQGRASEVASLPMPDWEGIKAELPSVMTAIHTVVDNGSSDDRLDYGRTGDEDDAVETVIVIGGGTLSRGLTLEGLIVSYFTRTSSNYDTLLQMGRWFGYRPGYEDLPRIWMTEGLQDDFEFLALVEEEVRHDMHRLEQMNVTPRDLGLRVRAHPGRLAITARSKMFHADVVQVSYSGRRVQTFILHETQEGVLQGNQNATKDLIEAASERGKPERPQNARWLFRDLGPDPIMEFIDSYRFHPDQIGLRADHINGWISRVAEDVLWNVIVLGSTRRQRGPDGDWIELGTMDLGLGHSVPTVNRAPLKRVPIGTANIKALMSKRDRVADLPPEIVSSADLTSEADYRALRHRHGEGRGLLVIYPISRHSVPLRAAVAAGSRREMHAPGHLVGVGLIFPEVSDPDLMDEGDYYSVAPDWEYEEIEEELPEDREGDAMIDGEHLAREASR